MAENSTVLTLLNPQPAIKSSEGTRGLHGLLAQTLVGRVWPLCCEPALKPTVPMAVGMPDSILTPGNLERAPGPSTTLRPTTKGSQSPGLPPVSWVHLLHPAPSCLPWEPLPSISPTVETGHHLGTPR